MHKHKDLREFNQGHTVIAKKLDYLPSPKCQVFWAVPGMQWLECTKSNSSKDNRWTGDQVMTGQGSIICTESKGWPVWENPLFAENIIPALIRRCQKPEFIASCCVSGCVSTDGSEYRCCWKLLKAPTIHMWGSEFDNRAVSEGGLMRMAGQWGKRGRWVHGKKTCWWKQFNVLANVLLKKPGYYIHVDGNLTHVMLI